MGGFDISIIPIKNTTPGTNQVLNQVLDQIGLLLKPCMASYIHWQAFITCSRIVNFNIGQNAIFRDILYFLKKI